jgi:hypothetical protein
MEWSRVEEKDEEEERDEEREEEDKKNKTIFQLPAFINSERKDQVSLDARHLSPSSPPIAERFHASPSVHTD